MVFIIQPCLCPGLWVTKQSMMITHLLNFDRNSIGIVKISCSHSGHHMRGFSLLYSTFITFLKFCDTVVWCTPNWYAMSWSIRLSRNFRSTMMSWSNSNRTLHGPVLRYFDTCEIMAINISYESRPVKKRIFLSLFSKDA